MSTIEDVLTGRARWAVEHGDSSELVRLLPPDSIDAIVTDPPAGIGFMGKAWDGDKGGRDAWIAWLRDILGDALKALKPGGHALVWALPRTSHWTATAVEDAGFEVRDVIHHLHGTGFPKSANVSKAIDAAAGAVREVVGLNPNARPESGRTGGMLGEARGRVFNTQLTAPTTDAARQWDGWGTALKPAAEHWILARKPLAGTVAANVLAHGTGALNIAATRIGTSKDIPASVSRTAGGSLSGSADGSLRRETGQEDGHNPNVGRWPANVVLSHSEDCGETCASGCAVAELDAQSGTLHAPGSNGSKTQEGHVGTDTFRIHARPQMTGRSDSGGASRYFYCAKPSRSEREAGCRALPVKTGGEATGREDGSAGLNSPRSGASWGGGRRNHHPTVKSVGDDDNPGLMRWLVRLITPPGGVVLDLFGGSGSTGCAAVGEDMRAILFEREAEYVEIARARIAHAAAQPKQVKMDLFAVAP